jgi:N-acyl-D-aspartate/D-glutamate deacylase
VLFGFELTVNPFSQNPSYRAIKDLPLAEQGRAPARSDVAGPCSARRPPSARAPGLSPMRSWERIYLMGEAPDYEPTAGDLDRRAGERTGPDVYEIALDHMLSNDGRGMLYLPFLNYAEYSLDPASRCCSTTDVVPGLSDGGAHVGMICDGSFPTTNLVHWTRDRTRGPKIPLQRMVKAQCRDTAETVGLYDRGLIAPGYRAPTSTSSTTTG